MVQVGNLLDDAEPTYRLIHCVVAARWVSDIEHMAFFLPNDYDRYDWDCDEYSEGFFILSDYFMREYIITNKMIYT